MYTNTAFFAYAAEGCTQCTFLVDISEKSTLLFHQLSNIKFKISQHSEMLKV